MKDYIKGINFMESKTLLRSSLSDIAVKLYLWRGDRRLTSSSQILGFKKNMLEEIEEYRQATTEEEKLDALADICVIAINCNPSWSKLFEEEEWVTYVKEFSFIEQFYKECCETIEESIDIFNISLNTMPYDATNMYLASIVYTACNIIESMGYDCIKVLEEVVKEISSRTGSYSVDKKKWIKDTTEEAKAKWYKANFELCKKGKNEKSINAIQKDL